MSSSTPPPQQMQIERLYDFLSGADDESCDLVRAIEIYLRKFHLESSCSTSDVLGRTYLIANEKLKAGDEVNNLLAWLRKISFNVVRDFSKAQRRAEKKPIKLAEKGFITTQQPHFDFIDDKDEIKIACLYKAIGQLSVRDQEILNSRFIEELSWAQVSEKSNISTATARQAGNRALKRLRTKFFAFYEHSNKGGES